MVLQHKVGKPRRFGVVVLLGIVTFGIYWIVWHYKAHHEVFRQFELDRDGKDEGIIWMVLGYILFQPLLWVYQYIFVKNVQYVRQRFGMRPGITPGGMLGMTIPAGILMGAGFLMIALGVSFIGAEEGDEWVKGEPPLTPEEEDRLAETGLILLLIGLFVALAGMTLSLVAYGRLQASLNGVWTQFDRRMASLRGGGGPAGPPPAWSPQAPPPRPPGW